MPTAYRTTGTPWTGRLTRRAFVRQSALAAGALAGAGFPWSAIAAVTATPGRPGRKVRTPHDLVVAKGDDPAANTRKAVEALGGMRQFVKPGAVVVIKPNMAWDRAPEQAGNTNPAVVAELVALCLAAGAKRVNVFDRSCDAAKRCYDTSGIRAAAEARGAKVYFVDDWNAVQASFDYASPLSGWSVFRDAVECDTFINVPVLKHHELTGVTLSMKNLMGVCLGDRGRIHDNIGRKLADITDFIKPDLTVIDAHRVLTAHGPSGGKLADVALRKTLIAGTDPVLADAFAADFFGKRPLDVPYIAEAAARGQGRADLAKASIRRLSV
jgi:uncharacterized protein (DUF362 family)